LEERPSNEGVYVTWARESLLSCEVHSIFPKELAHELERLLMPLKPITLARTPSSFMTPAGGIRGTDNRLLNYS